MAALRCYTDANPESHGDGYRDCHCDSDSYRYCLSNWNAYRDSTT
jgi:hypothetical protein